MSPGLGNVGRTYKIGEAVLENSKGERGIVIFADNIKTGVPAQSRPKKANRVKAVLTDILLTRILH